MKTQELPELGDGTKVPVPSTRKRRVPRWFLWTGAAVLLPAIAAGAAVLILLRRAEPMLRASLIDTLQRRFHARVELDDMHVSVVDGFQVEGRGLRIWLPPEDVDGASPAPTKPSAAVAPGNGKPSGRAPVTTAPEKEPETAEMHAAEASWRTEPWIVVARLRFHASWRILPGEPIVVNVIHVDGVQVLLPPKADRPHLSLNPKQPARPEQPSASANAAPPSGNPGFFHMPQVEVRRIECDNARLVIERTPQPGQKPKAPLDFDIHKATLIPDGHGGPVAFSAELRNARPVGLIRSSGHFGPWVAGDPGALPVSGDYRFDNADLSTIKGIAGTLASQGRYAGTLRRIVVDGQTQTPDFRLQRVTLESGVPLTTNFHATVDGTNGDTWLDPVDAMLGHTHIRAKGEVLIADNPDGVGHGHDIVLDIIIDRGRIEDILRISADRETPFVTGNLSLGLTHFHLPPGTDKVMDKLQLDGSFHLSQACFSSPTMQGHIEELSLRGQGKPKDVKSTSPTSILSDMQGHFQLSGGTLQLPDLTYHVPGAEIVAHGAYGFGNGALAFSGDARLEASLSHVVGGWKGFLLKPIDPLLHKNGAGTDVPIHIEGTRAHPKFGVDFNRLGKSDSNSASRDDVDPPRH